MNKRRLKIVYIKHDNDIMKTKPRLSFWQIWNMCFGFLGIQAGFALQNAKCCHVISLYPLPYYRSRNADNNVAMKSFRALIADSLPEEQHTRVRSTSLLLFHRL